MIQQGRHYTPTGYTVSISQQITEILNTKNESIKEHWKRYILYGLYLPFFSDLQLEVARYFRIYGPGIEGMIVFAFKSFVKLREKLHTYLFSVSFVLQ
jgi:hypothetical protein